MRNVRICLALLFVCIHVLATEKKERPMVVIIPSYHNVKIVKANLDSVFNQKYDNYRIIYISDGDLLPDSDGTGVQVEQYVKEKKQEHRFTLIRNKDRQLALRNWYKAVLSCADDEIVVSLDGDDELAHPDVLSRVNAMYSNPKKEVWLTYGNFKLLSTGKPCWWVEPIKDDVIKRNAIRTQSGGTSHLRTFKAWLFKQIKIEDLFYGQDFYKMSCDTALFLPMLECAGVHTQFCSDILYVYNDASDLNDHRLDRKLQLALDHYIRAKPPYLPLVSSKSGALDHLKEQGKLKADMVIFSDNSPDRLGDFLRECVANIQNYGTIRVFYKADKQCVADAYLNIAKDFHDLTFDFVPVPACPEKFQKTFENILLSHGEEDYMFFVSDKDAWGMQSLDLSDALYWLELTHASGFHVGFDKNMLVARQAYPIQISLRDDSSHSIYAWRYKFDGQQASLLSGALVRKNDVALLLKQANPGSLVELDTAWKNSVHENNVGLAYRGSI